MQPNEVLQDWVDSIHAESVRFTRERIRPITGALRRRASTWDIKPMPDGWGTYTRKPAALSKRRYTYRKVYL